MVDAVGTTHDVLLAGEGYQIVPGSYRRAVVPLVTGGGKAGEAIQRQESWRGRRVAAAGPDGIAFSRGFLPVDGGRGLMLGPRLAWDTTTAGAPASYTPAVSYGGQNFVAAGEKVYQVATVAGNYAGLTEVYSGAGDITQLVVVNGLLYACMGSHGYVVFNGAIWSGVATAATFMIHYGGVWLRAYNGALYWYDLVTLAWVQLPFYHRVTAFLPSGAALLIGTDEGLFRMVASLEPNDPDVDPRTYDWFTWSIQPVFRFDVYHADHCRLLAEYRGWVYYWHAGRIWRWRGGEQQPAEAVGSTFTGLVVAGGWLVATLYESEHGYSLWLHDGEDWWRLQADGEGDFTTPGALEGVNDARLVAWAAGTRHLARWNLAPGELDYASAHTQARVELGALDGGDPETVKQWTGLGVDFGVGPVPGTLSATPHVWYLDYSTDQGATWTTAAAITPASLYHQESAAIAVSARRLWVRLRAVWARWRRGVSGGRRRRWEMRLRCSDQVAQHTGARDGRSGRALASDLLGLVGAGAVAFRDVDYPATLVERSVQVMEAELVVGKNWEPRGGEAEVRVALEEIA